MKKTYLVYTLVSLVVVSLIPSIKANETSGKKSLSNINQNAAVKSGNGKGKGNVQKLQRSSAAPGLIATSYDWERKRIMSSRPYTGWIELQNDGSQAVTIQSASGSDPNFNVDLRMFMNLTIQPGAANKRVFPVEFMPTSTGIHFLSIIFVTKTPGVTTTSQLKGIGISGRLKTYDINFDSTIVGSLEISRRQLKIECESWEFQDSVIISDIVVTSGTINPDLKRFSEDGFRYDKQIIGLPKILQPGEIIVVDICEFLAPHYGDFNATLTTVSDAESEATSRWVGVGISDYVPSASMLAIGGSVEGVALGSEANIVCSIQNTGNLAFFIDSIALAPDPQFTIIEPKNPKAGFPLLYTPVVIQISYKPNAVGTTRSKLHIYSSELGKDTAVDVIGSTGNVNSISENSTTAVNESTMSVSPNPLGAAGGTVQFSVPQKAVTELSLYNIIGTKVAIIMEGLLDTGEYNMKIPVEGLPSGTYILRMTSGLYKFEQQLVVVK